MRLLSYNIHKGIGGRDRGYDLARVARVIEREHADLYCLQEVTRHARRTHHDDQPKLLAERFGCPAHIYQTTVHYREGGYGNLLLSRWPLLDSHHVCLRWGRWKPRGAQIAIVASPDGPLRVVNLHLGLRQRERHWQIEHLLHHHRFRESAALPTLIVGDFNDWRNKLASAALAELGYNDATRPESRFRSFPAFLPVLALDKAFHRNGIRVTAAHLARTPLAHQASDHLPLVLDFRIDAAVE
jgi:endonuclease/exonuclease/phosphatase family metal-dependent hydrolase